MTSDILDWLAEGDLRTDGGANEVAGLVAALPHLLPDLMEALRSPNEPLRGHAADALEKVARSLPGAVLLYLDELIQIGRRDPLPMVRWHIAMVLGHLRPSGLQEEDVQQALLAMLEDKSVMVKCWAIASLCILVRRRPEWTAAIAQAIQGLASERSLAVRSRVRKALAFLMDPQADLPDGWVKSHLQ